MPRSKKDIGTEAEKRVSKEFNKILSDFGVMLEATRASGQSRGDGDFILDHNGVHLLIEVKHKEVSGHPVSAKEFEKTEKQAQKFSEPKELIFVTENKEGKLVAHMPLKQCLGWLYSLLYYKAEAIGKKHKSLPADEDTT